MRKMNKLVFSFLLTGLGTAASSSIVNIPVRKTPAFIQATNNPAQDKIIVPRATINPKSNKVPDDYSPIFQHAIDSCIQHNIPEYDIPAGRYVCREPLILANPSRKGYSFFSLTLKGTATFSGADGTGTILDFSTIKDGFGIGVQAGKGVQIRGLKLIGAFHYAFPGAYKFYNTQLKDFTDGKCRDSRYSPYFAVVIDPFGPSIPPDGGYPGLSSWYKGNRSGSTGTVIEDCFFTNWVGGIITSPNGQTQNAELTIAEKIQFANLKICVAGCQDQEKMNRVSDVECWGIVHTCFATALYGAGSVGNWYLDHWNIAGYTQQIALNNQAGYFPSYFSEIFAESIARIGQINSINGTTFSNSSINFADYREAGSYTDGMISGSGITFIGCQLRMYGTNNPVTIYAPYGLIHFRDCSFETVPFFTQSYPYGYCDFQNCNIGNSFNVLNPMAPQTFSQQPHSGILAYGGGGSNVAAKCVPIDGLKHKLNSIIQSSGKVDLNQVIVASTDGTDYRIAGIVTSANPGSFTISYLPSWVDSNKSYNLYLWKTLTK